MPLPEHFKQKKTFKRGRRPTCNCGTCNKCLVRIRVQKHRKNKEKNEFPGRSSKSN